MSNLESLAEGAKRYNMKIRKRSTSSSSSSSGYGSIISKSEEEEEEITNEVPLEKNSINLDIEKDEEGNKKLDRSNKGMKLLLKMGWNEGSGLGLTNNGRKEPIPTPTQTNLLGIGKLTQDNYMLKKSVNKPKELESIIISRETIEDKKIREDKLKLVKEREDEREDRLKTFYCSICDKGYTNISQFEEHERSYAHHHAKRAIESKQQVRKVVNQSKDIRREKERKREEKELKRMAIAVGVNINNKLEGGSIGSSNSLILQKTLEPKIENKFKSSGFNPIKNQDQSNNFKPIVESNNLQSSSSNLNPPKFIKSSSSNTSFKSSSDFNQSNSLNDQSNPSKPMVSSKFTKIAERLAAKRANGETIINRSKKSHSETSELERMLEEGF
ncbi:hypothetical protein CROQUDRAFT_656909 [Cronartium quercuum f. sp. fusiforme G11]|uniref:G-patch-domain-containing protein n=1 Tax=Cronartium quercuum f. sp. fusiforme G11 TaxID=708437 RepID=A0A9P6NIQ9_9BASI|nr:hypothetical protein CROQUDRAFT_656909 [Cronartium quercuum f. sp. fusiforme G11]